MIVPDIALEKILWKKGFVNIAGVDEAGRGPWAGPVTAGVVIIHSSKQIVNTVRDSKLMTPLQREKAFGEICKKSSAFGIGIVNEKEIDNLGIAKAVKKAMLMALNEIEKNFKINISYILVDGSKTLRLTGYKSKRIKKGGLYHYSIAGASVLAKVTRDRIMRKLAKYFPKYEFDQHVGYGTKMHIKALMDYGVSPIHRKSFIPIKNLLV